MGYKIISVDISAQEPMLNTLLSKEPRWFEVFRNCEERREGILRPLDLFFQEYYGLDPEKIESEIYWVWVDKRFHEDKTDLVKLQILFEDPSREEELIRFLENLIEDFESFKKIKS